MITVDEAFQYIKKNVRTLNSETIQLCDAVGRVLAEDIVSDVDSPPHNKSVMDGFAVQSTDIANGRQDFEVLETVIAGAMPTQTVGSGTCSRIMTGAPMPEGADAVVMVEQSNVAYSDPTPTHVTLVVDGPLDKFQTGKHMMERAQNFSAGDVMFTAGHQIRPTDIGLLAEVGAAQLPVIRQPSIAIAPTGDELVDCSQLPSESQIRNSNGPMLRAICESHNAVVTDLGIGADSAAEIEKRIRHGLQHDALLLSGGVSAGTMDLVPGILASCGVRKIFHKVKVKPGKPIYFGVFDRDDGSQCVVFGLPGNPVSSLIGMHLFVSTTLRIMTQNANVAPESVVAVLSTGHQTRGNRPTYWPGRVTKTTDNQSPVDVSNPHAALRIVEPLPWNGSSDLLSLGTAEGVILFPARSDAWQEGEKVEFFPL